MLPRSRWSGLGINIFLRAILDPEPTGNMMLPAGASGESSSGVNQTSDPLPLAQQPVPPLLEIPAAEINEEEIWKEIDSKEKNDPSSPYYMNRVKLRELLKEKVDSHLNRKLSIQKYRRIVELLGPDSSNSFLQIYHDILEKQSESPYFQKALRIYFL